MSAFGIGYPFLQFGSPAHTRRRRSCARLGGVALTLESMEKQHILKMLDFHGGNRQKTADILGISRKTLYRKLTQYAID